MIVDAENPDQKLKPGLTATITIFTKELKDIITVPAQALAFTPDATLLMAYYEQNGITMTETTLQETEGKTVWIQNKSGILEQKTIVAGDKDGVNVQIVSGVNIGDQVVTSMAEAKIEKGTEVSQNSDSPFMPKPPSRKNKKATQPAN